MTALPKRFFTPEEYLILEDRAEYKSQYVDGEIFAMAGAEPEHVEITDNLTFALRTRFRGRPCRSYASELRVRVEPGGLWTYPDVVALCGEPKFDRTGTPATLLNPQVIFEVLSPSTASFDRGDKLNRYRLLESLTDYVLVAADRMRVEHHTRQANGEAEQDRFHAQHVLERLHDGNAPALADERRFRAGERLLATPVAPPCPPGECGSVHQYGLPLWPISIVHRHARRAGAFAGAPRPVPRSWPATGRARGGTSAWPSPWTG